MAAADYARFLESKETDLIRRYNNLPDDATQADADDLLVAIAAVQCEMMNLPLGAFGERKAAIKSDLEAP